MNVSSDHPSTRSSEESKAQLCLLLNVAATPGLGSLVARRWVVGSLQILLAIVGFVLIMMWFYNFFLAIFNDVSMEDSTHRLWQSGLVLFGTAWAWGLMTGLTKLRAIRLRR